MARLFLGGKEILYYNEEKRIDILNLINNYQAHEKDRDRKNCKRNVVAFAEKSRIACEDGMLCVYDKSCTEREPQRDYRTVGNIIIELCEAKESYKAEGDKSKQQAKEKANSSKFPLLQIGKKKPRDMCALLKKFEKEDINHGLKFLLATSLIHIKGGKRIFFNCLKKNEDKWMMDWRRFKGYEYFPQRCKNGGCPYVKSCCAHSLYDKLSKKIIKLGEKKSYIKIEEAQEKLECYFQKAIHARGQGIHLIKAQTAIGKTKMYCDMAARHQEIKFMFVVPTIKLQEEICEQLIACCVEVYKTKSSSSIAKQLDLEVFDEIQEMYNNGCGNHVKSYLRNYIKENKDTIEDWKIGELEHSLDMVSDLDGSCCVVTTHKLFLHLPLSVLNQYTVVVDEDILMTVVKENHEVPMELIDKIEASTDITDDERDKLKEIRELPDKTVKGMSGGSVRSPTKAAMMKYGKVYGLLNASVYYVNQNMKAVHYFTATPLPNVKMIVLSATLNEKLYQDYCAEREVNLHEVPEVQYQGKLVQFTHYSMSRECIKEKGKENIMQAIKELTGTKEQNLISFKSFDEQAGIYFGKSEGFNEFTGKNVVVLGTPHCAESVYYMLGKYLGYDTDDSLTVHRIEKNQYSFPIMTYKNQHLRNLQLFFLESELEQAVGRARLLRKKCVVHLFSNFPLGQTVICQDDYLQKQCPNSKS